MGEWKLGNIYKDTQGLVSLTDNILERSLSAAKINNQLIIINRQWQRNVDWITPDQLSKALW